MTLRIVGLLLLSVLGYTRLAEANHTLATAVQAALGEKRSQSLAAEQVAYFAYELWPDRSYAAFCWPSTFESSLAFGNWCLLELHNESDISVGMNRTGIEGFPKAGALVTLTPTSAAHYYARVVNKTGEGPHTVNVIVVDTTLASPWFFVSAASGYDGFVEIRNQTNFTVSVTLRAYAPAGTLIGSTTLSLPPNGNTFVAVGATLGATTSGSATITHNASPGGIVANITTLSAATGLSFDSPFTPRMVWSIF